MVLWVNGGPGSSSMFGLFLENGPIRVGRIPGKKLDDLDNFQVKFAKNMGSPDGDWSELADLVYIDQPVGTGFSFGDELNTRLEQGSDDLIRFIYKLYEMYPEYKTRPLYITGESYGGKYLPSLATSILKENCKSNPAEVRINLKAALIGDPYASPVR